MLVPKTDPSNVYDRPHRSKRQSDQRPFVTDPYTAGDVVDASTGAGLTFTAAARANGLTGSIFDASLVVSANAATNGDFECWLFDRALAAYDNDNDTFTPTNADLLNLIGVLQFATPFVGRPNFGQGGNVSYRAAKTFLPITFKAIAETDDLFGVLVVRNAYVPIVLELFTVILNISLN